jgi:hypothetical protein
MYKEKYLGVYGIVSYPVIKYIKKNKIFLEWYFIKINHS